MTFIQENLLDRQEFFHWVVELMEKVKSDDMILKLILPVVMRASSFCFVLVVYMVIVTAIVDRLLCNYVIVLDDMFMLSKAEG